jgi:hypothetical protein
MHLRLPFFGFLLYFDFGSAFYFRMLKRLVFIFVLLFWNRRVKGLRDARSMFGSHLFRMPRVT